MSNLYTLIKRVHVTEKSTSAGDLAYTFRVQPDAGKHEIRDAIEKLFSVKVARINTSVMPGKPKRFGRNSGRRSAWKKALVTLRPGFSIDFGLDSADAGTETTEAGK